MSRLFVLAAIPFLALVSLALAQERINADGIDGTLLLIGRGVPADQVKRFTEQAGDKARVITLTETKGDVLPGVSVAAGKAIDADKLVAGGLAGIVIDDGVALLVKGRTIRVLG